MSQTIHVCRREGLVRKIEVYGCAGTAGLKDQQRLREWEKGFKERNLKVKRPGRWEDSPDIALLRMGGVNVDHSQGERDKKGPRIVLIQLYTLYLDFPFAFLPFTLFIYTISFSKTRK